MCFVSAASDLDCCELVVPERAAGELNLPAISRAQPEYSKDN